MRSIRKTSPVLLLVAALATPVAARAAEPVSPVSPNPSNPLGKRLDVNVRPERNADLARDIAIASLRRQGVPLQPPAIDNERIAVENERRLGRSWNDIARRRGLSLGSVVRR